LPAFGILSGVGAVGQDVVMVAGTASLVSRDAVRVKYVEVADVLAEIQVAWPSLEALVGDLRGHHFLAVFDPIAGWYRACVAVRPDSPELELPEYVVPGGDFLRVRLQGEPPALYEEIGPAYHSLVQAGGRDDSRPSIEAYRRHDEIDVLMPVR
jgi:hypothetical protein